MASRKTQEALAKGRKTKQPEPAAEPAPVDVGMSDVDVEKVLREGFERAQKEKEARDARERAYFDDAHSTATSLKRIADALDKLVAARSEPQVEVVVREPTEDRSGPAADVAPPPPPPPKHANGKVDLKAAQAVFLDVVAKDRPKAVATLKQFGVERVSALPAERYADFVAALSA